MIGATPVAEPRTQQAAERRAASDRLVSIDILRGLAILWVIVFHLYEDMTLRLGNYERLYSNLPQHVLDGKIVGSVSAVGEIILGQGYLGVPMFMMLSGISLTMNSYRRPEPGILRGYWIRFRRVVPVYWAGVLLFVGCAATIALLQVLADGGSFSAQWSHVTLSVTSVVQIGWSDVAWGLSVGGFIARDKTYTATEGSLWFVQLLLAYYLIFPFALVALRKIGPGSFALAGIGLTIAIRAALSTWGLDAVDLTIYDHLWFLAPFRMSEFFIGMSVGYLLACRRQEAAAWVRSPIDSAGVVVLGILLIMAGAVITDRGGFQFIASDVIVQVGIAAIMLPLLFKIPGRLEVSLPARALVSLGVVSFTALIVNDMMRYVSSFLRVQGVSGPAWWFFLVVIYVPVGTFLAYPLARVFGLLPAQRARARTSMEPAAPEAEVVAYRSESRRPGRRARRRVARAAAASSRSVQ